MSKAILSFGLVCCVALGAAAQDNSSSRIHVTRPYRGPLAAAPQTPLTMTYNGGPIMNSAPVTAYVIYYGTKWTATQESIVDNFLTNLGGTKTYGLDAMYFDSTGTKITNSLIHDPSLDSASVGYSRGKNLSDSQIRLVVRDAIRAGTLPADGNGVYFVMTDPTVTSSALGGFCVTQCGYHFNASTIVKGMDIKYAFIGNAGQRCPASCSAPTVIGDTTSPNNDIGVDGAVSVLWHELSEAVTDPDPDSAWADPVWGETGDECAWKFGALHLLANGSHSNQHIGSRNYLIQLMPFLTTTKLAPETWRTVCRQRTN